MFTFLFIPFGMFSFILITSVSIYNSSPARYDFSLWDKSTNLIVFGREARLNAAGMYDFNTPNYAGSLYLLAFYKRALSASEIKQNYNAKIRRNGMKRKENISSRPLVDPSPVTEPLCSPLIE